ncbi:MAG: hypothetical protein UHD09_01770 [Bifidobacterium sp.]|nr:hypothetical protein [Bifidobacterium sp.]
MAEKPQDVTESELINHVHSVVAKVNEAIEQIKNGQKDPDLQLQLDTYKGELTNFIEVNNNGSIDQDVVNEASEALKKADETLKDFKKPFIE